MREPRFGNPSVDRSSVADRLFEGIPEEDGIGKHQERANPIEIAKSHHDEDAWIMFALTAQRDLDFAGRVEVAEPVFGIIGIKYAAREKPAAFRGPIVVEAAQRRG